jgi:uncharacterized protein (DUF58 family)
MLTVEDIRCLGRLTLAHSHAHAAAGSRQARTHGHGFEFRDYRHYQPGDDPRFIDWTVDARLRQLVVRVFRAEGQLRLQTLIDTSASMGIGSPSKLACAARLAAALAYVAVERRDSVGVATFDETIGAHLPAASGRPQLFRTIELLQSLTPAGASDIDRALTAFGGVTRGPALAVVISDFLDPRHRFEGLRLLMYRGLTPAVVQVVADEDLEPGVDQESELVDAERPDAPPLFVDRSVVAAYRERIAGVTAMLREFCITHHLPWMQVRSTMSFDAVLTACVDAGLVAVHA